MTCMLCKINLVMWRDSKLCLGIACINLGYSLFVYLFESEERKLSKEIRHLGLGLKAH